MAMFKCPDCKTKISTSATACPKCGRPVTPADLQKKGPSKSKKILVTIVCVIIAGFWLSSRHPNILSPQATSSVSSANSELCKDIKTVEDWEKADTFWRIGHPQCMPKANEYNYSWTQQDISDFLKKTNPSYQNLGGYKIVFERNDKNWCAVAFVFPQKLSGDDMQRISKKAITSLENFFTTNGAQKVMSARAYGKGQPGDMIAIKNPFKKDETVYGQYPNYLETITVK